MDLRPAVRRSLVAALTLVLAVSIVDVADPPAASATLPGASGRIAWQKDTNGTNHIWTMELDGSDKVDLGSGTYPSWSPDGSKLVFASSSGIEVMDANGSNRTVLRATGTAPAWSPDGLQVAFVDSHPVGALDIYVMNANGSDAVDISSSITNETEPSWSPDGTKIVYQQVLYLVGTPSIFVMGSDGSNPTNLTANGAPAYAPDWSPDGSKIAYSDSGIWTMSPDGSNKVKVSADGSEPAWSPDAARIAFTSTRDFNEELYSIAANGSDPRRLTNDNAGLDPYPKDTNATWQPAAFGFSPSPLAFGDSLVGSPTTRTVTMKAGTAPVSVTAVTIGGADAADFTKTSDTCSGLVIAALGTCVVTLSLLATSPGAKVASLTFDGPAPLGSQSVAISAVGRTFLWGPRSSAGPSYTFNFGRSLASSKSTLKTYLHGVYTGLRVGGKFVTDSGPRAGAYYIRSSNRGTTWTTPKRLNPSTQHGTEVSVASSGKYIYTAWISTKKYVHYSGSSARALYFRRNTNHGSTTAWSSTIRLTSTLGRIDAPTIAASGAYVYVTWTDANSGSIRVAISSNHGKTFRKVTIGSTTNSGSSGKVGAPRIAAAGSEVAVVWLAAGDGTTKVRTATAYGGTWGATTSLGPTDAFPDISMSGNRLAVAWGSGGRIQVRVRTAGVWGSTHALPDSDGHASSEVQYDPAIAIFGGSVGVAYSACVSSCDASDAGVTRSDLIWRQTSDDGETWAPSDTLGSSDVGARQRNDSSSVVWTVEKRPSVLWNGWTQGSGSFRLSIRSGV